MSTSLYYNITVFVYLFSVKTNKKWHIVAKFLLTYLEDIFRSLLRFSNLISTKCRYLDSRPDNNDLFMFEYLLQKQKGKLYQHWTRKRLLIAASIIPVKLYIFCVCNTAKTAHHSETFLGAITLKCFSLENRTCPNPIIINSCVQTQLTLITNDPFSQGR